MMRPPSPSRPAAFRCHVERSAQVDAQQPFELAFVQIRQSPTGAHPGTVHHDIDPAKPGIDPGKHGLHLIARGNIRLNGQGLAPKAFYGGYGFPRCRCAFAIVDDQTGSVARQPQRDFAADAAPRPGYKRDLSGKWQFRHVSIPFFRAPAGQALPAIVPTGSVQR